MSLTFRLLRIPVRVHAWFILTAVLLFRAWGVGWDMFPLWAAIVFQGVLMHEYGHALTGRAFGLEPVIELTAFAGVTRFMRRTELSPWRSVAVSFAGPAVGIVIGVISLVALAFVGAGLASGGLAMSEDMSFADLPVPAIALLWLGWVNLGWALFNLVPIMPLDGGNIMAAFFRMFSEEHGTRVARYVSLVMIAALGAVIFAGWLPLDPLFTGIFLAMFAFGNVQALRAKPQSGAPRTVDDLLAEGYRALESSDGETAARVGAVLVANLVPRPGTELPPKAIALRDEAFHLLAWGRLLQDEPSQARAALDSLSGARDPDPALEGSIDLALGRSHDARVALQRALEGAPAAFVEKRWVTASAASGEFQEAREFATKHPDAVSDASLRALSAEALGAAEFDEAHALARLWFERSKDARAAVQAACSTARGGRIDDAFEWLERARDREFQDLELLDTDEDLAALRDTPRWAPLRASFAHRGSTPD